MDYKKILQTLEHITLIVIIAASIGFYFGNHYGASHVSLAAAKAAQVTTSK